ncbi:amino acid transporter [Cucurbitaria berberidis CBS 394.84]|uniref:Amino acid transporter n=1 Tax=Cucurbitaria berberidis CBS 394.84 TaxID=1168544 RepID=A0A9P4LE35_9PLEO|nr:amino acid transporter [Cucurbitaria berberidis CBS 394.84]KAF1851630.1 amino acid transporter [Cucurbitaria berberidis CBS 394.84]
MALTKDAEVSHTVQNSTDHDVVDFYHQNGIAAQNQVLHRKFGFWSAFGILLCCSGAWEGLVASLAQSLHAGSSVSLVWGWVATSVGMIFIACSLAELASRFPTSGGQYHWVAQLAPPQCRNFLSWFTCWMTIAALWLGGISCTMGVAVQVQAYASLANPGYVPLAWHVFLITVLITCIYLFINIFYIKLLHVMNIALIVVHITGFLIVIIVMVVMQKDKHDASFVFTHFENGVGWRSDEIAWIVGLLTSIYAFFSLDSATHYAEEVEHAEIAIPRAMLLQVLLNALMTFPFIIALLFCIGDVDAVLVSPLGLTSPFTQILYNITGSTGGSIFLAMISTYVAFAAGVDLYGAAGRMVWCLARDKALPQVFSIVHPKYDVPVNALLLMFFPTMILPIIYIWNSTAFYGIMAGVLVFFQLSYFLPIFVNATYARWNGKQHPSAWSMGRFGWIVDIISCFCTAFIFIFMSFPVYMPLTATTMNYASVIFGAVAVLSTVLWFSYARSRYNGPIYSLDTLQLIDGQVALDAEMTIVEKKTTHG